YRCPWRCRVPAHGRWWGPCRCRYRYCCRCRCRCRALVLPIRLSLVRGRCIEDKLPAVWGHERLLTKLLSTPIARGEPVTTLHDTRVKTWRRMVGPWHWHLDVELIHLVGGVF